MMEYCKCGNEIRYCGTPRCGWPPKEQASSGKGELLFTAEQMKLAYQSGWVACSEWASREDLVSDIDSPAYLLNRQQLIQI